MALNSAIPFISILTFYSFLFHILSDSQYFVDSSPSLPFSRYTRDNSIYEYNTDAFYNSLTNNSASDNPTYESKTRIVLGGLPLLPRSQSSNLNVRSRRETTTVKSVVAVENSRSESPSAVAVNVSDNAILKPHLSGPMYHVKYYTAFVDGLRLEPNDEKAVTYEDNGASIALADAAISIRLFGRNFTNDTVVRFATELRLRGEACNDSSLTSTFQISHIYTSDPQSALVKNVVLPASKKDEYFYVCIREQSVNMPWVHQGPFPWLTIKTYKRLLPFWAQASLIVVLLLSSGLFAGLTLGLLALDKTDLRILANTGSEIERAHAKTILPLRTRGNYLLCSLVFGNVLVNSMLTILLDDLTSGVIAVIFSTAGIVIIGEIIPQAICSRNGLAIGARTIWITKSLMFITFPLSYTISVILDKILGEEIGIVYNREKLKELIALTLDRNDLETDEVNIISGALTMKKKTVDNIMTRLEDIFMLPIDAVLDSELLSEIRKQGYSKIPVYDGDRSNIVRILFTNDLVFVRPEDAIDLRSIVYENSNYFFFLADTTLDIVFREFKEPNRGHMAFVQRINRSQEDKDPFCETIGLVTLEDVVEELIHSKQLKETHCVL